MAPPQGVADMPAPVPVAGQSGMDSAAAECQSASNDSNQSVMWPVPMLVSAMVPATDGMCWNYATGAAPAGVWFAPAPFEGDAVGSTASANFHWVPVPVAPMLQQAAPLAMLPGGPTLPAGALAEASTTQHAEEDESPQHWPVWPNIAYGEAPQWCSPQPADASFTGLGPVCAADAGSFFHGSLRAPNECEAAAQDVEEQSEASSDCSTAPSMQRRKKHRLPPAQRQIEAAKYRQAEKEAKELLKRSDKLHKQLSTGGDARCEALKDMHGLVWQLSIDKDGCRIVQAALEAARGSERADIVNELTGHVREAMGSPHANYVIQKVVEVMPIELARMVAQELAGIAADACRHRYGCRIMSRLVQQFASNSCVTRLVEEMMKEITDLARHNFGHHVVNAILEHGTKKHKRGIAKELAKDMLTNATSRNGTYVVERALLHCESQDVAKLLDILADREVLHQLMLSQFGIFVVKTLAFMPGSLGQQVCNEVYYPPEEIANSKYHQKLLELLSEEAAETTP
mmetsp:Transcript_49478/g.117762  ORF Transcript_49478/g.117762 Transcript_49478/m.117762 type:complete len:515 (+) Transcript_49478:53-1597(+)